MWLLYAIVRIALTCLLSSHTVIAAGVQFDTGDTWLIQSESPAKTTLTHQKMGATITITQTETDLPIDEFQSNWMNQRYDGWVNLGRESGTLFDVKRANATAAYKAIYAKTSLTDGLKTMRDLVIDYYFIKSSQAYIVSIATPESELAPLKPAIKAFLDGFYIGSDDDAPTTHYQDPYSWSMSGKTPVNTNEFPIFNYLADDIEINWQTSFDLIAGPLIDPVITTNWYALASGARLLLGDSTTGDIQLDFSLPNPLRGSLATSHNLLFFIVGSKSPAIIGLVPDTEQVLFRQFIDKTEYLSPIIIDGNNLFIQASNQLHQINYKTDASRMYPVSGYLPPVITPTHIIVADSEIGLQSINRETDAIDWSLPIQPVLPVTVSKNQLLVTRYAGSDLIIDVINPKTGANLHTIKKRLAPIKSVISSAQSGQYYGVLLQDRRGMNYLVTLDTQQVTATKSITVTLIDQPLQSQTLIGSPNAFQFIARHNDASYVHTIRLDTKSHTQQALPNNLTESPIHHRLYSRFAHHAIIGQDKTNHVIYSIQ